MGRPKKRGRKKKRKSRARKKIDGRVLFCIGKRKNYKIVSFVNKKQNKAIGNYATLKDAYDKIKELLEESEKVIFPKNNRCWKNIIETTYEYLILERNPKGTKKSSILKNDLGVLTEQTISADKWIIVDKFKYNIEETFWVWGYNPRDRKTYTYIYNNILLEIEGLVRVLLYKNKVLFKHDDGYYDIVFCKDMSDGIRFYNKLLADVKETKIKNILFIGDYSEISDKKRKLETELVKQTGFRLKKIQKQFTI